MGFEVHILDASPCIWNDELMVLSLGSSAEKKNVSRDETGKNPLKHFYGDSERRKKKYLIEKNGTKIYFHIAQKCINTNKTPKLIYDVMLKCHFGPVSRETSIFCHCFFVCVRFGRHVFFYSSKSVWEPPIKSLL